MYNQLSAIVKYFWATRCQINVAVDNNKLLLCVEDIENGSA